MIPILFDADAKDFSTRGLGPLADAISCKVVEERNSTYELTMQYPKDGIHFSDIGLNKIILAIPSPYREPQPFRIYKISTPMQGKVTINAQHISYDLSGVAVMPFTGNSVADVLNKIKLNSVNTNDFDFTGNSDFVAECIYNTPYTARQILGGIEGSVIDRFGGEYEFDKFTVKWSLHRGVDNGVTVRYGKNLLTLNQDVDISKIVTGVVPYWASSEDGSAVIGDRVNMDGEYNFEKIIPLDLTQEFQEAPSKEQLESRAKSYIDANYSLEPDINCTVSFALIEQYDEYKDFKLLEKCDLCDTVTVQYPDLGVNSTAKIVKIDTDVLKERYNSVTIGTVRANIAQTIVAQQKAVENIPSKKDVSDLVSGALGKVMGAQGGTVRFLDTNDDGEPDTLYIADNADPKLAKQVWRFNYLGWAASSNGYNGPFTLGATLEDGLLADFVTAANLTAGTIKSADNGNTFFLDLVNGILRMKATSFSIGGKSVDDIAGSAASSAANREVNNFVNSVFNPEIQSLQNQIDGQIETYFYDYAPSDSRLPTSEWNTETERAKHEGDLFFDKSTGYAYRYYKNANVWKWQLVKDTDITTALQDAAAAKDTADSKRRTFIDTPYPPYDEGDLWTQGPNGDIMRCIKSKESGQYDPGDWQNASGYTDDTAANAAEAHAARNTAALEIANGEIALRAKKEELDSLGKRVTTAESSIEMNAESIKSKVSSGDVQSIIDQNADSIRLKADKIAWESENSSMTEDGEFACKNASIGGEIKCENIIGDIRYGTFIDPERGVIFTFREVKNSNKVYTSYKAQDSNYIVYNDHLDGYYADDIYGIIKEKGITQYGIDGIPFGCIVGGEMASTGPLILSDYIIYSKKGIRLRNENYSISMSPNRITINYDEDFYVDIHDNASDELYEAYDGILTTNDGTFYVKNGLICDMPY